MKVRIRARFYNENFREARIAAGFFRMKDLHNASGISLQTIYRFENFSDYPRTPIMIRRVERALGLPIDDLFPAVYKDAVNRKLGRPLERVLSLQALPEWTRPQRLPMPEEFVEANEMRAAVERALKLLTEREEKVLRMRFGLHDIPGNECTLEEIAHEYRLSRERIRHIEAKALRKLLHPRSSRSLREHLPPAPQVDNTRMRKIWPGYAVYEYDQETPVCVKCRKMLGPCDTMAIEALERNNEYFAIPPEVLKWPKDFLYCEHCHRIYRRRRRWNRQEEIGKA